MGQAWYGVPATTPAGDVALLRQANDVDLDSNNSSNNNSNNTPVDQRFVQKLVEEAAAQVYEDVHLQLKNIQENSLLQTQQMVRFVTLFVFHHH